MYKLYKNEYLKIAHLMDNINHNIMMVNAII